MQPLLTEEWCISFDNAQPVKIFWCSLLCYFLNKTSTVRIGHRLFRNLHLFLEHHQLFLDRGRFMNHCLFLDLQLFLYLHLFLDLQLFQNNRLFMDHQLFVQHQLFLRPNNLFGNEYLTKFRASLLYKLRGFKKRYPPSNHCTLYSIWNCLL